MAHTIPLGSFVQRLTTASDLKSSLLGDQQCSRGPVSLLLLYPVPSPTSSVIKGGTRAVQQEGMSQLVREVTSPTAEAVRVVVHDEAPRTIEDRES